MHELKALTLSIDQCTQRSKRTLFQLAIVARFLLCSLCEAYVTMRQKCPFRKHQVPLQKVRQWLSLVDVIIPIFPLAVSPFRRSYTYASTSVIT